MKRFLLATLLAVSTLALAFDGPGGASPDFGLSIGAFARSGDGAHGDGSGRNWSNPPSVVQDETAKSDWSGTWFYDVPAHQTAAIVTHKIHTFTDVLGNKSLSLDLDGFVGATTDKGKPVVGVAIGKRGPLAKDAQWYAALGIPFSAGQPISWGLALGISAKF